MEVQNTQFPSLISLSLSLDIIVYIISHRRECLMAAGSANTIPGKAGGMSVAEVIKIVRDTSRDETVLKYLTRFRQKLKQPLQPE
jgi:hypothetical protein